MKLLPVLARLLVLLAIYAFPLALAAFQQWSVDVPGWSAWARLVVVVYWFLITVVIAGALLPERRN